MARKRTADARDMRAWWRGFDRAKLPRAVLTAGCGIVLAAVSAAQAATTIYDRRNPILSKLLFGSNDARITLWTAQSLTNPKGMRDGRIVGYGQNALRRDPLNPSALRAMAYYYDASRQWAKAKQLAVLSGQVSRRDALTQLLLTQYAARDNNSDVALDHLNTALTTVGRGREQVFPIISAQLRNSGLRLYFARLLEPRNTWISEYLDYMMRHDEEGAKTAAEILLSASPPNAAWTYEKIGGSLMSSLAETGEIALLKRTYARARGNRPDVTARPALDRETTDPALGWLAWTGVGEGSVGADLRPNGERVEATVYVSAGTNRALALRRVLFLSPGRYRHFEKRSSSFGPNGTIGQFEMKCIGGPGLTIWKGPVADSNRDVSGEEGPLLPAGCQAQMLELYVSSPLGGGGSEFIIENFNLRRAG